MYEDMYFLNAAEALRVASEQNRWEGGYSLQVCYYDGEKIESDLVNLVHLPIENLLEGLVYGRYRVPTKIDFTGLDISAQVQVDIVTHFNVTIEQVKDYRKQLYIQHFHALKNARLDFSEPLRFLLMANDRTTVMQYVSKNIADTLKEMGYDVYFDLLVGIEDMSSFKLMYEFNPHVLININHFNHGFLSEDVFNFVWFQDPMEHLFDDKKLTIRKRDFIYSLNYFIDEILQKKGIPFKRQGFCVNDSVFFDKKEPREEKIIFIGSSLIGFEKSYSQDAFTIFHQLKDDVQNRPLHISKAYLQELAKKYSVDYDFILTKIYPHSLRETCVEYICKQEKIKVEVYGRAWESNEIVKPFFKGEVPHGEKIVELYNSAKYALAGVHPYEASLQRFPEVVACGAIPVMYNIEPFIEQKYEYEDMLLKFNTFEELVDCLDKDIKDEKFEQAVDNMSYKKFAKDIIQTIHTTLESENE